LIKYLLLDIVKMVCRVGQW